MRYDSVVIGGGLSGLVCGIKLQRSGKRCLIISYGQNAMHFSSGSFGLLSYGKDGKPVSDPVEALKSLPAEHPYSIIGAENSAKYALSVKDFFKSCGIMLNGDPLKNSYMISPVGVVKPAWLSMEDVQLFSSKEEKLGEKALVVGFSGYLDFNSSLVASGLEKFNIKCREVSLGLDALKRLRQSPSEMRSVNISRVVDKDEVRNELVAEIKKLISDEDVIVLPSVFGLCESLYVTKITSEFKQKVIFAGTMPPSVPGIRSQIILKNAFEKAGGTFLLGDEVVNVKMEDNKVKQLFTANLQDTPIEADNFVLASGSFFSKGLLATPTKIVEPLFGLDVSYPSDRADWYDSDFFSKQNYLSAGLKVDSDLHPMVDGAPIKNLYAIGSILGNADPVDLGCGAGVSIVSAMRASDLIIG